MCYNPLSGYSVELQWYHNVMTFVVTSYSECMYDHFCHCMNKDVVFHIHNNNVYVISDCTSINVLSPAVGF